MQKSYNPFKMSGPWIGLIIGFLLGTVFLFLGPESIRFNSLADFFDFFINGPYFISLTSGFVIGWLIHSIVRKLKN